MVSGEGACAAYYNYGRFVQLEAKTNQSTFNLKWRFDQLPIADKKVTVP